MRLTVNCHKTDKNVAVNVNLEEWVIIIIKRRRQPGFP